MADTKQHLRLILRNFLSQQLCEEFEFIHKSCCTVGYRPNVFSTTLSHLIATNSAHLVMPFVPIREKLKERVEEHFGCEYELFVEFTGLIRMGNPQPLHPWLAMFSSTQQIIKMYILSITEGERITLTLWFSRDSSYNEDAKLLLSLSECSLNISKGAIQSCFHVQASDNMFWFPPEEASRFQSGFDIRTARLHVLGFDIFPSNEASCLSALSLSHNYLMLLGKPLHLVHGDELLMYQFFNILHALQVAQFHYWKASESKIAETLLCSSVDVVPISELQRQKIDSCKGVLLKDLQQVDSVFGQSPCGKNFTHSLNWLNFSALIIEWEAYTHNLQQEMLASLPHWITYQSIFAFLPSSP